MLFSYSPGLWHAHRTHTHTRKNNKMNECDSAQAYRKGNFENYY